MFFSFPEGKYFANVKRIPSKKATTTKNANGLIISAMTNE